jgi:hypothetical protein
MAFIHLGAKHSFGDGRQSSWVWFDKALEEAALLEAVPLVQSLLRIMK